MEENKKTIALCQEQVAIKEKEKVILQGQLNSYLRVQERLDECREELQRVTLENGQLKEKFRLQEVKLTTQKTMVSRVNTEQPSMTSTISNMVHPVPLPLDFFTKLWSLESTGPMTQTFFKCTRPNTNYFFSIMGLRKFTWIDHGCF